MQKFWFQVESLLVLDFVLKRKPEFLHPLEKEMATHSSILAWELVLSFLFQVLTECKV